MYYNKQGEKITLEEWSVLLSDMGYKRIDDDDVNGFRVSTIWLGLDHGFDGNKPLIFETMVFKGKESEIDMDRYSTEEDAINGHKIMVEKFKNK